MNVKQLTRTLTHLPPRKSVLIESKHGMGKSAIVAQSAAVMSKILGKSFGFIDIRLGQYEVGDLIGMPRSQPKFTVTNKVYKNGSLEEETIVAENVTVHDLPLWFPRDKNSRGFLFFDEINRGTRDTQQWAFQVVLDYRVNFVDLPEGWNVIAACNENQDIYNVISLDPALYDRFLVIKFRPTVPEWLDYAVTAKLHDAVVKYIQKHHRDLDPPDKIQSGVRYPSRRSWEALSCYINHYNSTGDDLLQDLDYLTLLSEGFVGATIAYNFVEFVRKDYKVFTAKEILNNFPRFEAEFKAMQATDLTYYNQELIDYIKGMKSKLSKNQCENLFSYVKMSPKEIREAFWVTFLEKAKDRAVEWFQSDSEIPKVIRASYTAPEAKK